MNKSINSGALGRLAPCCMFQPQHWLCLKKQKNIFKASQTERWASSCSLSCFLLTGWQAGDVHLGEVSSLQDDHAEAMRHRLVGQRRQQLSTTLALKHTTEGTKLALYPGDCFLFTVFSLVHCSHVWRSNIKLIRDGTTARLSLTQTEQLAAMVTQRADNRVS